MGQDNGEALAHVGVRLNAQLGATAVASGRTLANNANLLLHCFNGGFGLFEAATMELAKAAHGQRRTTGPEKTLDVFRRCTASAWIHA